MTPAVGFVYFYRTDSKLADGSLTRRGAIRMTLSRK